MAVHSERRYCNAIKCASQGNDSNYCEVSHFIYLFFSITINNNTKGKELQENLVIVVHTVFVDTGLCSVVPRLGGYLDRTYSEERTSSFDREHFVRLEACFCLL